MVRLGQALKEWSVAVHALAAGEAIALLRKGGIRELGGQFTVRHQRIWLYPTVEHQKLTLLQPAYAERYAHWISASQGSEEPALTVCLNAWAEITDIFDVRQPEAVMGLMPFHVWNQAFVTERLQWQPQKPVTVLVLRVYRLLNPSILPVVPAYRGCRSWIDLEQEWETEPNVPALAEAAYRERVLALRSHLGVGAT